MTSAYPKPENWAALLHQMVVKPGFPATHLGLGIFRLQAATGGLTKADQYIAFAETAMRAGLLAEAKAVLDKSYAGGVLGTGPEADRQGRLRDMVKHKLEANQAGLANAEAEAGKQPTGSALVAAGINAYGYGQYEKAINLVQAGIAKGGLANPDDAKLHLGVVELAAGKEGQGVATLKVDHERQRSQRHCSAVADQDRRSSPITAFYLSQVPSRSFELTVVNPNAENQSGIIPTNLEEASFTATCGRVAWHF